MADRSLAEDPRVERSRRVILQATLEEFAEVGYAGMTIESVARRAGVGKATIYRHWAGKLDLVGDALETLRRPVAPPEEGPARERIVTLLEALAEVVGDSSWSMCMPALIEAAARDETVRRFHRQFVAARRQILVDLVEEGLAAGEFESRLDPVLLAELLAGPIFYRRLITGEPFPVDFARRVVDQVLPPGVTRPRAVASAGRRRARRPR
jgi:AcrR family transcriptional regulator